MPKYTTEKLKGDVEKSVSEILEGPVVYRCHEMAESIAESLRRKDYEPKHVYGMSAYNVQFLKGERGNSEVFDINLLGIGDEFKEKRTKKVKSDIIGYRDHSWLNLGSHVVDYITKAPLPSNENFGDFAIVKKWEDVKIANEDENIDLDELESAIYEPLDREIVMKLRNDEIEMKDLAEG